MAMGCDQEERRQDRALAAGLKAGRSASWDEFYALYAPPLFRFVLGRSGGDALRAEDILQDAIVVAVQNIRRYDPAKGTLWNWLCGIAVNKVRETARASLRESPIRSDRETPCAFMPPSPDGRSSDLLAALVLLHPRYQEVLILKYIEDRTVREIAQLLDASEKATESRLTRAREALRAAYKDWKVRQDEESIDG